MPIILAEHIIGPNEKGHMMVKKLLMVLVVSALSLQVAVAAGDANKGAPGASSKKSQVFVKKKQAAPAAKNTVKKDAVAK